MAGACNTYDERRGAYRVSVVEPEGNGPIGKPRARWDDNINTYIQVVGWDSMD